MSRGDESDTLIISSGGEDSDSDSLPTLAEILKDFKIPKWKTDISAGDIVWAKYKNLYWPALVRHVYPKEKKITIWYTDEPGKTFKIPLKNVCLFRDWEMTQKIEKDALEAGCGTEHHGLTFHARMYLDRKEEGLNDDPRKFFDQTYPYFLMEELLKKDPNADVNSIKIPHLYITPEKKLSRKKFLSRKETPGDDESSIECVSSDESDSEQNNKPKDYLLKVTQEYSSAVNNDKNTDEIVKFIKAGKADVHLKKIEFKRVSSMYYKLYEESIKSNKKSVAPVTYTGPLEDDEKLREIIFYLLDFHDKHISNRRDKPRRSKSYKPKLMEYTLSDKKSQNAQFVGSVLLPEAIIYAMSKIKKTTLRHAKQLFQKESESKTDAIEKIIASLGSEGSKNTSESSGSKNKEDSDECVIEKKDLKTSELNENNDERCSPVKKLCVR